MMRSRVSSRRHGLAYSKLEKQTYSMKNHRFFKMAAAILAATAFSLPFSLDAQVAGSDSYAATDALGRKVGTYDAPAKDKTVIMFYWTWHQMKDTPGAPVKNITQILGKYPEAIHDYDHEAWWGTSDDRYCYWDEPLFGYYRTTDKWVLRKHAEMLADAKVDAVFFDCSNGSLTWDESTDALMEVWDQAQKDGVDVPKIGFLLPFGPAPHARVSLMHLYDKIYSKGLYSNLWFYWNGKPLIFAYPEMLDDTDPAQAAAKSFFCFRPMQPDYVDGPVKGRNDQWSWLEVYPQHGFVKLPDGSFEQVSVGVAQNTFPGTKGHCSAFNTKDSYGRSYTFRKGFDTRSNSFLYGANFDEQWDRAYELDPQVVFLTGWNEWIAGCWPSFAGSTKGEPAFVDQYDWDHSRDIEPVKAWGNYGDVYYLQAVDRIRRFKGTSPAPAPSAPKTVRLSRFEDWDDVQPEYSAYKGNTGHRDALGKCDIHYVDCSGRNDITGAKVARDNEYVYFHVRTAEKLTPATDRNWMMLFLDVDRDKATGWEGYDYVVNYETPEKGKATVSRSCGVNAWNWQPCETVSYEVKDNQLVIRIPRSLDKALEKDLDFEFKWVDNMQDEGNPMDFYVSGDSAPLGRFNYVFTAPIR